MNQISNSIQFDKNNLCITCTCTVPPHLDMLYMHWHLAPEIHKTVMVLQVVNNLGPSTKI